MAQAAQMAQIKNMPAQTASMALSSQTHRRHKRQKVDRQWISITDVLSPLCTVLGFFQLVLPQSKASQVRQNISIGSLPIGLFVEENKFQPVVQPETEHACHYSLIIKSIPLKKLYSVHYLFHQSLISATFSHHSTAHALTQAKVIGHKTSYSH